MKAPRIAVVIPSHNDLPVLRLCLEAIRDTADYPNLELVVVDNGSTDGTIEWLDKQKGIRSIRVAKSGVAGTLNEGFAATSPCDVVRIHADVVVETQGWLRTLAESMLEAPMAGIMGVKLLYPDERIQSVGRNIVTGVGMYDRYSNLRAFQPDTKTSGSPKEVDTVPGAFSYYRREVLDKTGGLDERYCPIYFDDDDICMMARWHGYKVFVNSEVKATHYKAVWSPTTKVWLNDLDGDPCSIPSPKLERAIMDAHAPAWYAKWGWNPFYPDLSEIRRLYGHTEICWRIGEPMRFQPGEWPPTVDVVIVTWNNLFKLRRCMESLAQTRYPHVEVHVVDNSSTDGTLDYLDELKTNFPFTLHVIKMAVNTGVPVGLNWGVLNGKNELVARLDDDIVLPPDWLSTMVEDLRARPFAAVVGPKVLNDNEHRDIQCGPYRHFPAVYGHDGEPDNGQADYISRTSHVRGCCNLYRRDALVDSGLFDLRYSPSQCDDPDHHIALACEGYEILYDGRVSIVHSLTGGAAKSYPAMSNAQSNWQKLYGKWGREIWMILDRSIDLSREGRYFPVDYDMTLLPHGLPDPCQFPSRKDFRPDKWIVEKSWKILRYMRLTSTPAGPFRSFLNDHIDYARSMRRDGHSTQAAEVLHSMLDLAPRQADTFYELAVTYDAMGQPSRSICFLKQAIRFEPANPDLVAYLEKLENAPRAVPEQRPGSSSHSGFADRSNQIGEIDTRSRMVGNAKKLRVLIANTFQGRVAGGDMHQIKKTKQTLENLGLHVDVAYSPCPDPKGYDLIHVFNLWFPEQTLPQVKAIRRVAPHVPIVLSPIYWDASEKAWADRAVPAIFSSARDDSQLNEYLRLLANGQLLSNGSRRMDRQEPNYPGYEEYQRQILQTVDYMLPQSNREVSNMQDTLGVTLPYTIVHNAAETKLFDKATPDWFINKYGIRDFVITVGLVEPRKNQLMLLYALRDSSIPVVVIGRNYDMNYLRLCRKYGSPKTVFIEHLTHEHLASALKAARVFVLPSWMECAAFANIEAALAGCALVVSDRTSELEYFGDCAYYCDPADVVSIRNSVMEAYLNYDRDIGKRNRLREKSTRDYTWENTGRETLRGYKEAIALRGGNLGSHPCPRPRGEAAALPGSTMRRDPRPEVSIVIPTFNRLDLTRRCLHSLYRTTFGKQVEILVVDNGSTDGTREFLLAEKTTGRLGAIFNGTNLGFAVACNQGARMARGRLLLFLNNDTEARFGWLDPLIKVLDNDPKVAIVGSKLLYPDGTIQHAGVILTEMDGVDPLRATHAYPGSPADLKVANEPRVYQAVTGACMMVRKAAFESIGGFDMGYLNGYEDVDFCLKFQERGQLVVYEPESVLIHHESQSGPERFRHAQRNIERFHRSWLGKVDADFKVGKDGVAAPTNEGRIRPYTSPAAHRETQRLVVSAGDHPVVSFVILTLNQLEHTRLCLESIWRNAPQPFEVIVVDNGSRDGTPDYLRSLRVEHDNLRVIRNSVNLGFSMGNNQGIAVAKGEFLLLLNNDTILPKGAVERMLSSFEAHQRTGLVGPMSNCVSGPQLVRDASYCTLETMEAFVQKHALANEGRSVQVLRLVGFCLLVHRKLIHVIGGLDDRFGCGNFEDDDFCLRASFAGFEARIACDAFVHHLGSQTFKGENIDHSKSMLKNWDIFKGKWGIPKDTSMDQGYDAKRTCLTDGRLFVDLPDISRDHEPLWNERWWQDKAESNTFDGPRCQVPRPCSVLGATSAEAGVN